MTRLSVHPCATSSPESSLPSLNGSNALQGVDVWQMMRLLVAILFAVLAVASATGCTRTILVPEASPIRIGHDARAHIYVLDPETKAWRLSDERVKIPEGWYCVPPSFVEEPDDR